MTLEAEELDIGLEPADLSSALRQGTLALHRQAERSGLVADLLRGRATRQGYALFLRNLAPAYQQLEIGLEQHRSTPGVRELARREVYRSDALETDLAWLFGADWRRAAPLLAEGWHYADRIAAAAKEAPERLIGHAYVRYLGDLSGGQILKRILATSPGIPSRGLTFYDFPDIEDLVGYKRAYQDALDVSGRAIPDRRGVIAAAVEAFSINIRVSEAVRRAVLAPAAEPIFPA